jgi:hypothetical protein
MSAVNCPRYELRFATKNERDDHLPNEHRPHHLHRPAPHATEIPLPAPVPPAEERTP